MRVALLLALAACDEPCEGTTWEGYADGFFISYCQGCHASTTVDRYGAPPAVHFDDLDAVLSHADAILAVTDPASPRMPPGGGVPEAELERMRAWIECVR